MERKKLEAKLSKKYGKKISLADYSPSEIKILIHNSQGLGIVLLQRLCNIIHQEILDGIEQDFDDEGRQG
jgi:hypothetical protein